MSPSESSRPASLPASGQQSASPDGHPAMSRWPPRRADMTHLLDTFLACAVLTILIVRTELYLTNYPQVGGHGLHIAHLLWGGASDADRPDHPAGLRHPLCTNGGGGAGRDRVRPLHGRGREVRDLRQQLLLQAERRDHLLRLHRDLRDGAPDRSRPGVHQARVPLEHDRDGQGRAHVSAGTRAPGTGAGDAGPGRSGRSAGSPPASDARRSPGPASSPSLADNPAFAPPARRSPGRGGASRVSSNS